MTEWQTFGTLLKKALNLELEPVGISIIQGSLPVPEQSRVRICKAFIDAANGQSFKINRENNACFGAAWHLGFHQLEKDSKVMGMVRKFVVEGEKLFASYDALDALMSQIEDVPNHSESYFYLSPLEQCPTQPQLVIFVCNPEEACRLLTLSQFADGVMPKIKIGGPTCRLALIYPLLSGEVNVSFYDYTARKICNVDKDKLLVSIPYKKMPQIIQSIEKCTAGTAKMEYPAEFREFLQKRLSAQQLKKE
ncbi:MAG: DUF169 domain-containing protein [Candidatus Omnitrophota bacterium]